MTSHLHVLAGACPIWDNCPSPPFHWAVGWVIIGELLLVLGLSAIAMTLYMLPSIIAAKRKARGRADVIRFNVYFGWTVLGWVICWAEALAREKGPADPEGIPSLADWRIALRRIHAFRDSLPERKP